MMRALLLTLASLLLFASSVSAECAWVLWNEETRQDFTANTEARVWHVTAAAPTKVECETRLRQEIEMVTHPETPPKHVPYKVRGDAVQFFHFPSDDPNAKAVRWQTFGYACLPDPVDPRGSTGK